MIFSFDFFFFFFFGELIRFLSSARLAEVPRVSESVAVLIDPVLLLL